MIIPFSNSISPMETSLPVCPFRQGRFPFCGRFAAGKIFVRFTPHDRRAANAYPVQGEMAKISDF